jgi:hypothetical protein
MGEHVLATTFGFNEAKTFCIVEPFHRSDRHAGAPFPLIGGILNLGLRAVKASGGGLAPFLEGSKNVLVVALLWA